MTKSAKRSQWWKRGLGLLVVAAVVGLLVVASMPKPVAVDIAEVTQGDLRVTVDEDGHTRVKDRFVTSAPLTGNVARIELRPGDPLDVGDVVARMVPLDPPMLDERSRAEASARLAASRAASRQARAAIARAEAALTYAKNDAERKRRLLTQGGASQQATELAELEARTREEELQSARFAARVADHEVQMSEAALGRLDGQRPQNGEADTLEVHAPVSGRVLRVMHENEGVVQAGTPLVELGDVETLEVVVDVLTTDAVHIEPGARVEIVRWGGDGTLVGEVRRVEPSAFSEVSALGVQEQRVNVLIDLTSAYDDWQRLGDGFRVEAKIVVWEAEDVVKVPMSAAFRHEDGWAVYRVIDGAAVRTPIEAGRHNGLEMQVNAGLSAGDAVIVHPGDQVDDGVSVEAR